MTPEQLKELEEKAKLWDELSPILKTIHGSKFERPNNGTITIENTSNASTHIDLLKEENKEMVKIDCSYCGRVHCSTMCKLHPAPCKNK